MYKDNDKKRLTLLRSIYHRVKRITLESNYDANNLIQNFLSAMLFPWLVLSLVYFCLLLRFCVLNKICL